MTDPEGFSPVRADNVRPCGLRLTAERDPFSYAAFLTFFPVLLAGPVGRAREFLPQLKHPPACDAAHLKAGALRFAWGAFKKLVAADCLGLLVDAAYADPSADLAVSKPLMYLSQVNALIALPFSSFV